MPSDTSIDSSFLNTGPPLGHVVATHAPSRTSGSSRVPKHSSGSASHAPITIDESISRFDGPHPAIWADADLLQEQLSPADTISESEINTPETAALSAREAWLNFHASDLILRLQEWATDLDAREANLNAAYARLDLRERQFRLSRQQVESQIADHLASAEKLRLEMQAHARRLAFDLA